MAPLLHRAAIINTITSLSIAELSCLAHDQPLLTPGDTLWAAGCVIKAQDPEFPHSNWNGWMKTIHAYDAYDVHFLELLPCDAMLSQHMP